MDIRRMPCRSEMCYDMHWVLQQIGQAHPSQL